jgi:hypothetical protein
MSHPALPYIAHLRNSSAHGTRRAQDDPAARMIDSLNGASNLQLCQHHGNSCHPSHTAYASFDEANSSWYLISPERAIVLPLRAANSYAPMAMPMPK